jgi:maltose/moltooligosaccharide transporter
MTPPHQRAQGFALQTWFIGAGAVLGSLAPAAFKAMGIANTAPEGVIPPSVRYSFYLGALAMVAAVAWTALRVKEYSPAEMAAFADEPEHAASHEPLVYPARGALWMLGGALCWAWCSRWGWTSNCWCWAVDWWRSACCRSWYGRGPAPGPWPMW